MDAQAVYFDPRNDIAILRVERLDAAPLPMAQDPRSGTSAAILGFPLNGPFDVRAGRLGDTHRVTSSDAYGRGPVQRSMTALRGLVRPGNSGGPMVDGDGRVVTTVFAATTRGPRGGFGVPNQVVRRALADAGRPGVHRSVRRVANLRRSMAKTLVIAEKPSVGRDLSRVLPGAFQKHEGYLETDDHVMTWAVGHLVQLAEPDEYDAKYKKWRMADLPIVPDEFRLVVRDERSKKQMGVITKLLNRPDVEQVVNACDAGREGELIFAWTYEKANADKPVQPPVAVVDDDRGDQAGARRPAPARRSSRGWSRRRGRAPRPTGSWA